MTTIISLYNIVGVRAESRVNTQSMTWRHIILTHSDGRETRITMYPEANDKPDHISIVDHELPEDKMSDKALAEASARDWKAICALKESLPKPWKKFE